MALYTISDLHLSVAAGKPMDVFGAQWHDHAALLAENWKHVVRPDDTVVLVGDHSWGLKEAEYVPDLEFINALPGRKILTKGNHDLWWATASKLRKLTEKYGLDTLSFMQGNAIFLNRGTDPASENSNRGTDPASENEGLIICATRGWKCPGDSDYAAAVDGPIYRRETMRLAAAIEAAQRLRRASGRENVEIVVFLHFPPFGAGVRSTEFTEILEDNGIRRCFYGHLHGIRRGGAPVFEEGQCRCTLVSSDHLGFTPLLVN
ncbi:MAG: metallophosphoesterase [Clostridia bacterium]|nr:metallophosphoesterase [Clostridia bacterium]